MNITTEELVQARLAERLAEIDHAIATRMRSTSRRRRLRRQERRADRTTIA